MTSPEGAEKGARFGRGIMGFNKAIEALAVVSAFPWEELPEGTTVNHVGGGVGHIIMELSKRYPHLKVKLQDFPERIEQAKNEVWPKECPKTLEEGRVEFKALEFFKEPPITGCDVYYVIIFLLTDEYILQTANRVPEGQSEFNHAPEPLLANYGMGQIHRYNLDLDMMNIMNSQERKLEDFIELGTAAGLEFVKFWDFGEMNVVEFGVPKA